MSRTYYAIDSPRCGCPCTGEGLIILICCSECGNLIGICSELDNSAYKSTEDGLQFSFDPGNPYGCPYCHVTERGLNYATVDQLENFSPRYKFIEWRA